VKVGDTVRPGQVLAREDPFSFNESLNQAKATLAQQQAELTELIASPGVPGAGAVLEESKRVLAATRRSVDAQDDAAHTGTVGAWRALRFAAGQLSLAEQQYRRDGCGDPDQALHGAGSASRSPGSSSLVALASGSGVCSTDQGNVVSAYGGSAGSGGYLSAKTAYQSARHSEDGTRTAGRISIRQAQSTVIADQNALDVARTDRPSDIAGQRAVVAGDVVAVAVAQHNVDETVLYAPVGGNVSAVTGAVGEYLTGSAAVNTALAPGTDASIPGVGAAATSDQAGNAASGISATRPGDGAFIVLNNIDTYQVVVPFEESDAAKVRPNERVQVTFDAIPDLELAGTVLSVAPNGVNISGVTNYYATILLVRSDPRLKAGQTAEASVVTNSLDNVLVVPNAAVIKQGGSSYVNLPGPNGEPTRQRFTPGAVGDDNTQVLSGLSEGQQILLPQGTAGVTRGGG
jgi:HlyD family secretion protein